MVKRRGGLRYIRLLAAALLPLALLAGCGDDDPPVADPPEPTGSSSAASPSGSPSSGDASPTATPSSRAEEEEIYVRSWVATQNEMLLTGDTSAFREMGTKDCESCDELANSVDQIYDGGGRVEGGQLTDIRAIKRDGSYDDDPKVRFTVHTQPTKVYDSAGKVTRTFDGQAKQEFSLVLRRVDGTLRVRRIGTYG